MSLRETRHTDTPRTLSLKNQCVRGAPHVLLLKRTASEAGRVTTHFESRMATDLVLLNRDHSDADYFGHPNDPHCHVSVRLNSAELEETSPGLSCAL